MIRRADARLPSLDSEQVSAANEEFGLPEETDKAFNAKIDFKAWGAELRGGVGALGAPVATRFQLFLLTQAIVSFRFSTRHILEQRLGIYTSALVSRSECFRAFSIYMLSLWPDPHAGG